MENKEIFNRIKYKTKKEWLQLRIKGIGGSDASSILGLNPYKSNLELWKEKTLETSDKKTFNNETKEIIEYGTKAEAPLRDLFNLTYKGVYKAIETQELLQSKEYPFMLASLDGEITELETGRKGVYEGKTARLMSGVQFNNWKDKVPDNYYIQVLWYLLVTGYEFAIINAELRTDFDEEIKYQRKIYRIERKEVLEDIEYLKKEAIKFWDYVERKEEPPLKISF